MAPKRPFDPIQAFMAFPEDYDDDCLQLHTTTNDSPDEEGCSPSPTSTNNSSSCSSLLNADLVRTTVAPPTVALGQDSDTVTHTAMASWPSAAAAVAAGSTIDAPPTMFNEFATSNASAATAVFSKLLGGPVTPPASDSGCHSPQVLLQASLAAALSPASIQTPNSTSPGSSLSHRWSPSSPLSSHPLHLLSSLLWSVTSSAPSTSIAPLKRPSQLAPSKSTPTPLVPTSLPKVCPLATVLPSRLPQVQSPHLGGSQHPVVIDRRQERLMKNRHAADLSRKRKREQALKLESSLEELQDQNSRLTVRVTELEQLNAALAEDNRRLNRMVQEYGALEPHTKHDNPSSSQNLQYHAGKILDSVTSPMAGKSLGAIFMVVMFSFASVFMPGSLLPATSIIARPQRHTVSHQIITSPSSYAHTPIHSSFQISPPAHRPLLDAYSYQSTPNTLSDTMIPDYNRDSFFPGSYPSQRRGFIPAPSSPANASPTHPKPIIDDVTAPQMIALSLARPDFIASLSAIATMNSPNAVGLIEHLFQDSSFSDSTDYTTTGPRAMASTTASWKRTPLYKRPSSSASGSTLCASLHDLRFTVLAHVPVSTRVSVTGEHVRHGGVLQLDVEVVAAKWLGNGLY
ncbi:hypothetical protein BSLG_009639 [Batrachochytrium salamandrivorans]|nr:hypothetical protein BSLG_009639 [Batrachochytrium salamandrivorans]